MIKIEIFRSKQRFGKNLLKNLVYIGIFSHFIVNLMMTGGFLYVSSLNYPGAQALIKIHEFEPKNSSKCLKL